MNRATLLSSLFLAFIQIQQAQAAALEMQALPTSEPAVITTSPVPIPAVLPTPPLLDPLPEIDMNQMNSLENYNESLNYPLDPETVDSNLDVPEMPTMEVPETTPEPEPESGRKVIIVVVNGGYNSCAGTVPTNGQIAEGNYLTTMGDLALEFVIDPLKIKYPDHEMYWIVSCFWGNDSMTLQVKRSTNPTQATIENWYNNGQYFYDSLAVQIQSYMGGVIEDLKLVMIGHSNGGYNILKTAQIIGEGVMLENLRQNTNATVTARVFTFDPISVACSPTTIALGFGTMPPACLRAPTATEINYTVIGDKFNEKHNYYQDDYATLHSGPISQGGFSNTDVDLPGVQNTSNNSHTRITSDATTWSSVGLLAVP